MESSDQQRQGGLDKLGSAQQNESAGLEPRPGRRLCAPLFDRLTGSVSTGGQDKKSYRFLDFRAAIESVQREVDRLLNTRTTLQRPGTPMTTREYGLPEFAFRSASNPKESAELALQIARAIEAFEPRLRQVRVTLEPHPSGQRFLTGTVSANLMMHLIPEPVVFPISTDSIPNSADAIETVSADER